MLVFKKPNSDLKELKLTQNKIFQKSYRSAIVLCIKQLCIKFQVNRVSRTLDIMHTVSKKLVQTKTNLAVEPSYQSNLPAHHKMSCNSENN